MLGMHASYLFMWRPLERHSQVGTLQRGVLERLCRTPELQTQLQPKRVLTVELSYLKIYSSNKHLL